MLQLLGVFSWGARLTPTDKTTTLSTMTNKIPQSWIINIFHFDRQATKLPKLKKNTHTSMRNDCALWMKLKKRKNNIYLLSRVSMKHDFYNRCQWNRINVDEVCRSDYLLNKWHVINFKCIRRRKKHPMRPNRHSFHSCATWLVCFYSSSFEL